MVGEYRVVVVVVVVVVVGAGFVGGVVDMAVSKFVVSSSLSPGGRDGSVD